MELEQSTPIDKVEGSIWSSMQAHKFNKKYLKKVENDLI